VTFDSFAFLLPHPFIRASLPIPAPPEQPPRPPTVAAISDRVTDAPFVLSDSFLFEAHGDLRSHPSIPAFYWPERVPPKLF